MTKAEFTRRFVDSDMNTGFHNYFVNTACYDKQGRLFHWEFTTVKGTWENETYACVDWSADNTPIYTLAEMNQMQVLDYDVDLQSDCLILYLDI